MKWAVTTTVQIQGHSRPWSARPSKAGARRGLQCLRRGLRLKGGAYAPPLTPYADAAGSPLHQCGETPHPELARSRRARFVPDEMIHRRSSRLLPGQPLHAGALLGVRGREHRGRPHIRKRSVVQVHLPRPGHSRLAPEAPGSRPYGRQGQRPRLADCEGSGRPVTPSWSRPS